MKNFKLDEFELSRIIQFDLGCVEIVSLLGRNCAEFIDCKNCPIGFVNVDEEEKWQRFLKYQEKLQDEEIAE